MNENAGWKDEPDQHTDHIKAAHPLKSATRDFVLWRQAEKMVRTRHSKNAILELVAWLIQGAPKAGEPMYKWQPIETAPRGGTAIIARLKNPGWITVGSTDCIILRYADYSESWGGRGHGGILDEDIIEWHPIPRGVGCYSVGEMETGTGVCDED